MNIALDGGGLCLSSEKQFGNYTFSHNILQALDLYDKENSYSLYTFSHPKDSFKHIKTKVLLPKTAWMKLRVSLEEKLHPSNVFLALNQAVPLYTHAKIIAFSHGLSFLFHKDVYTNDYQRLKRQLDEYVKRADSIVVSSQRVKEELLGQCKTQGSVEVLPFGIPFPFQTYTPKQREPYFMFVGMNHPVKNVAFLVKAFNIFIQKKEFDHFKLYLIGPFEEYKSKNIEVYPHLSSHEVQQLYQKTTGYLSASLYESFNFPVLEALSQNAPVIGLESAIIPEMQKYVHLARQEEEFCSLMEKVALGAYKKNNGEEIKQIFSWEEYVKRLVSLY